VSPRERPPLEPAALRVWAEARLKERKGSMEREKDPEDAKRLLHELQVHQLELEMQNEELREARRQVEVLLEKYSDLYDFAPVGYVTVDARGKIRQANLGMAGLLGTPRSLLTGQGLGSFLAGGERRTFDAFVAKAFRGEGKDACDVSLVVQGVGTVFLRLEGEVSRRSGECLVAVLDVTARRKAEGEALALAAQLDQRVKERTADLEASNRELEAFSYSVSHDLRAPLRAIDGYATLLAEHCGGGLDAEGMRLLETIERNARKMGCLIDDLLQFSRTGRSELRKRDVDMDAVVANLLDELIPAAERGKVDVRLLPLPPAFGDPALIRVVLQNLVSNALKFSARQERPVVEIGSCPTRDGPEYFVRDNGVGFDPKYVGKLFGVFQRLHSMSEFGGTGIGLALSRRIVERHGGKIRAEGETGRGATFSFTLGPAPDPAS